MFLTSAHDSNFVAVSHQVSSYIGMIEGDNPETDLPEDGKSVKKTGGQETDTDEIARGLARMMKAMRSSEDWFTNDPEKPSRHHPTIKAIVEAVVHKYRTSYDFHGALWTSIPGMPTDEKAVRALLGRLVNSKRITFRTSGMDVNPAIQRLPDRFYDLAKVIALDKLAYLTLFPTVREMSRRVPENNHEPFKSMLERGHAQLDFVCFDLSVLEHYRSEPRYFYKASDLEGNIYVKQRRSGLEKKDKVYLRTFGFAYDKRMTRAVAVFLRYLSELTPEHQQQWKAKMLKRRSFLLHPDYFTMTIVGNWGTHAPILDAFLMELECINELCAAIGWNRLFRKTYRNDKPAGFTFLLRPTSGEFNAFVLLLDKMMSDNLDKDFFRGSGIELESETIRKKDGKIMVQPKGTIQLLEAWFKTNLRSTNEPTAIPEMLKTFREVRKLRQHPAHVEEPNKFDQKYFKRQRDLIIRAYKAVQTIRMLFESHPNSYAVEVPDVIKKFRIRDF